MNRDPLTRGLAWGLTATLLIPVVLAVTLGTAALLAAVGDTAAAAVCRWVAVPVGGAWVVAVVATTVLSAASQLAAQAEPRTGAGSPASTLRGPETDETGRGSDPA
ncbi:MAG: hypothetical protein O3C39_07000 [Planctomycetota bacterium]|jgi:hypothetical protein|nr:hypothetical protein [Planctomycetota bacterium]MDA1201417.1 hypothetical protein [Planctomycetota bacterium]